MGSDKVRNSGAWERELVREKDNTTCLRLMTKRL